MEDSDNLILMTLKQIGCKFQTESIGQLGSDDIISIVLQLFKFLGIDITPFKIIDQSQKYRVANKIRDELRKTFSVQVDFMIFINPNPSDIRKLLVSLISRMSAMESKVEEQNLTYEDKLDAEKTKKKVSVLKEWKNDEWLLPELQDFAVKKRKFLELDLTSKGLRAHLLPTAVAHGDFISLITSCVSHLRLLHRNQEKREREMEYGGKTNEEPDYEVTLKAVAQNNKDAWTVNYKKTANEVTFESKLEELVKEAEVNKEEKVEEEVVDLGPTLYGLEMQFEQKVDDVADDKEEEEEEEEEDDKSSEKEEESETPGKTEEEIREEREQAKAKRKKDKEKDLASIEARHKAELDKISQALSEYQQRVVEAEEDINEMETRKQKLEDELKELRVQNVEIEKKTSNLHELLQLLENTEKSEKKLLGECDVLEKELQEIKEEWNKQKSKDVAKIEKHKVTIEENKEKLEEFKSKTKVMETEYDALVQKIKTNQDVKMFLQNEFANLPKEVPRNTFVKRINEINASYLKQKSDFNQILGEVDDVEKKMGFNQSLIERHCTEIENTLKSNPKPDSLLKSIFKVYQDYKTVFDNTIKNLNEHGSSKLEARDLERKIESLQTKNYGSLIAKLQSDLDVLKQENEKLMYEYQRRSVKR